VYLRLVPLDSYLGLTPGGISEAPVPALNKAWYNLLHERSEVESSGLSQESSDHNRAKRNLESPTTFF
jgi:hypothetical protein